MPNQAMEKSKQWSMLPNKIRAALSHKQLCNTWEKPPTGKALLMCDPYTLIPRTQSKPGPYGMRVGTGEKHSNTGHERTKSAEEDWKLCLPVPEELMWEKKKKYTQERPPDSALIVVQCLWALFLILTRSPCSISLAWDIWAQKLEQVSHIVGGNFSS